MLAHLLPNARDDDAPTPSTRVPRPELARFRETLARAMIRKGLSASGLARAMWGETKDPRGYMVAKGRDRISAYMAGVSYPDPANRAKIAEALDIDPQELSIEPLASSPRTVPPAPPDISLAIIAGEPDIAALTMNHKIMSTATALKILTLIREDAEPKPETPVPAPAPASTPAHSLLDPVPVPEPEPEPVPAPGARRRPR